MSGTKGAVIFGVLCLGAVCFGAGASTVHRPTRTVTQYKTVQSVPKVVVHNHTVTLPPKSLPETCQRTAKELSAVVANQIAQSKLIDQLGQLNEQLYTAATQGSNAKMVSAEEKISALTDKLGSLTTSSMQGQTDIQTDAALCKKETH